MRPSLGYRLLSVTIFLLLVLAGVPADCFAANAVYVTAAGTGSQSGLDCSNTKPASYFNTSGSWSGSPTGVQIGPDTTVIVSGLFTGTANSTELTFQGSGTSGHPVMLLASNCSGVAADFTAPYWSGGTQGGAITTNDQSHIIVDGGGTGDAGPGGTFVPVGIIEDSANGTSLANQQASRCISVPSGTDITIRNWKCQNIYQRSGHTTEVFDDTTASCFYGGANAPVNQFTITNNVLTMAGWCIQSVGASDIITISHNDISDMEHSIVIAPVILMGFNNHLHDWGLWDGPCPTPCAYHHDGLHCFAGSGGQTLTLFWYNNLIDGNTTAGIAGNGQFNQALFMEGAGSPTTCMKDQGSAYIFNNRGLIQSASPGDLLDTGNYRSINSVSLVAGGNNYSVGNILTLAGGNSDGTVTVTSQSGGVITGISFTYPGTGYATAGTKTTTVNTGSGTGATINIGSVSTGNINDLVVNNTTIGPATNDTTEGINVQAITNLTLENNAYSTYGILTSGAASGTKITTPLAIDHNFYANCTSFNCFDWNAVNPNVDTGSFSVWQGTSCGTGANCDVNGGANLSSATYLGLDSGCVPGSLGDPCKPQIGSPLIGAAANLHSICAGQPNPGLGALCNDASGNPRPVSGPWDVGAQNYSSAAPTPAAPALGLFAVRYDSAPSLTQEYLGAR